MHSPQSQQTSSSEPVVAAALIGALLSQPGGHQFTWLLVKSTDRLTGDGAKTMTVTIWYLSLQDWH